MKLVGLGCVTLSHFLPKGRLWKQDGRLQVSGLSLGWRLSVLSLITFFPIVAVTPLWIGMCWHGPLIPKVHTLCILAIRSWSLNNMWEGKSSGGRESRINSLGQSVISLLGRWPGIDA